MRPKLDSYIRAVLGPTEVLRDWSWTHGKSLVLEVRDAPGRRWFVKQHRQPEEYRRELSAYRKWVPALGRRAPKLKSSHDQLGVLVLSAVPGTPNVDWRDESLQRDAGALLRRLHDVEVIDRWTDMAAEKLEQLELWAARADGLLEPRLIGFARSALRGLEGLPAPLRVPCHLDYIPRNWLITDLRVHLIDFEDAAPEVWVNDIGRLYFGWWGGDTQLQDAFLDGYGRQPGEDDLALLRASYALTAVSHVVLARQLGQVDHEAVMRQTLRGLMTVSLARRHL